MQKNTGELPTHDDAKEPEPELMRTNTTFRTDGGNNIGFKFS